MEYFSQVVVMAARKDFMRTTLILKSHAIMLGDSSKVSRENLSPFQRYLSKTLKEGDNTPHTPHRLYRVKGFTFPVRAAILNILSNHYVANVRNALLREVFVLAGKTRTSMKIVACLKMCTDHSPGWERSHSA